MIEIPPLPPSTSFNYFTLGVLDPDPGCGPHPNILITGALSGAAGIRI